MRGFKVSLNGKNLCLAGVGERGVLVVTVNWVKVDRRADLFITVGGLANEEHLNWVRRRVQVKDEIRVKIVETDSVAEPSERKRIDPVKELKEKKQYVRRMAKELGWKIVPQ